MKKTQIVIVGGGAGGLELARKLGAKYGRKRHDIILVEKSRTHIWKPLLHEVAAGALDANLDEVGYRSHGSRWGYRFFWGALEGIDRDNRQVIIAPLLDEDGAEVIGRQTIRYDYLVVAIGSVTNTFNTPGAAKHCILLDEREQADRFRLKLLNQCLRVSRAMSADPKSDAQVKIAIIGAGATGVELAAELHHTTRELVAFGLEKINAERDISITLIEAGARVLPALPERLSNSTLELLEKLRIEVMTGARVTAVEVDGVVLADGRRIAAELTVWAAGIKAPDFLKDISGLETNRLNQLVVTQELQTTRDPDIFALGDCAACAWPGRDHNVPPRAQAAHQQASLLASTMRRRLAGKSLQPFVYRDFGSLVSLGNYSTVGSLMGALIGGSLFIEGLFARLMYVSLYRMHLHALHGFGRVIMDTLARLITRRTEPRVKLH